MATRRRTALTLLLAPAALACAAVTADPLHAVGSDGEHRHEGSGWIYPLQVAEFVRTDAPYTIDGNNDVGAEYRQDTAQGRRIAVVEVYYPDSAADGARLETAKRVAQRAAGEERSVRARAEEPFAIPQAPGLDGVRIGYETRSGSAALARSLYFFRTSAWIVSVRTVAPMNDRNATPALDRFVRSLRWETLGTDPGDLHTPGG